MTEATGGGGSSTGTDTIEDKRRDGSDKIHDGSDSLQRTATAADDKVDGVGANDAGDDDVSPETKQELGGDAINNDNGGLNSGDENRESTTTTQITGDLRNDGDDDVSPENKQELGGDAINNDNGGLNSGEVNRESTTTTQITGDLQNDGAKNTKGNVTEASSSNVWFVREIHTPIGKVESEPLLTSSAVEEEEKWLDRSIIDAPIGKAAIDDMLAYITEEEAVQHEAAQQVEVQHEAAQQVEVQHEAAQQVAVQHEAAQQVAVQGGQQGGQHPRWTWTAGQRRILADCFRMPVQPTDLEIAQQMEAKGETNGYGQEELIPRIANYMRSKRYTEFGFRQGR